MKQDNKGYPTVETGQILPFMWFFILWEFNILTKKFISNSFLSKYMEWVPKVYKNVIYLLAHNTC